MTISIAGKQFPTRKPRNLDEVLIRTTGCNAAETLAILRGSPIPGRVAAAVSPFLGDDAPDLAELAHMIESDMAAGAPVVEDARKLFSSIEPETEEGEA